MGLQLLDINGNEINISNSLSYRNETKSITENKIYYSNSGWLA